MRNEFEPSTPLRDAVDIIPAPVENLRNDASVASHRNHPLQGLWQPLDGKFEAWKALRLRGSR
jgi:hypothetical protein